jgi:hypothetical protein
MDFFPIWAIIDSIIVLVVVLLITIYIIKRNDLEKLYSKRNRIIYTALALIIGFYLIYNLIIEYYRGGILGLQGLSDLFLSTAFILSAIGFVINKYRNICTMLFTIILGPGIFLKILLFYDSNYPKIVVGIFALAWLLLWISVMILFARIYINKSMNKSTQ